MGLDWAAVFDVEDADHLREHFSRDTYRGREYRHLTDARHGVERGTAVVDDVVIRGFPSIPRALVLDPTVPDFFDGPVTVEEKLNGYNVRVAAVPRSSRQSAGTDTETGTAAGTGAKTESGTDDPWTDVDAAPTDDLMAFTRGGFVCHFTTELVRESLDLDAFFRDHPTAMLCGEVVGPENPYTTHDYPGVDSAAVRVFDVRDRETGEPLPVEERRDRCAAYDLPAVREFGTHDPDDAVPAIREVIADLDEAGREGVVVKSQDGRDQLKYTTSAIHRSDLEHAFALPFDYGRDFVFPRVMREAFQAVEFDDSEAEARERARELGEAILLPAIETLRDVRDGEPVGERHTVRGPPGTVEALLAGFRDQGLEIDVREDHEEGGERVVEFVKVARSTRDKTRHYLEGGTVDE